MATTFTLNGRPVSGREIFGKAVSDLAEKALAKRAQQLHAKATSVVDPDTGKHGTVFLRKTGDGRWSILARGSPAYMRAVRERLGIDAGEIRDMDEPAQPRRQVYLAHATEDKAVAEQLARGLTARGIEVWYDSWEIRAGDSLRQKMDQGLGDCTHFVVLLTPTSIKKPWVNREIDAGLMRDVEGTAKFIGLRHDLQLDALTPLLRTKLTPVHVPGDEGLDMLAAEIYGVSKRPPLGAAPAYVQAHKPGSCWSMAARVVAEYFVRESKYGHDMDPQANYEMLQEETKLPMPDVRIGVLDLKDAGLVTKHETSSRSLILPTAALFVEFDEYFTDWNPEQDARDLAVHLLNLGQSSAHCSDVAQSLGWPARRFNPAMTYLDSARAVRTMDITGGDPRFRPSTVLMDDELLRYVRSL
ncbi:toll/interleukin-1 receptor domain-containing protein [Tistrella mobilis]|uniref:toll/interleukin-1 receptor domain-containing protein n=1 Tax=Tistrella mobilis TaxID=171437 RepID=UPI003556D81F